MSERFSVIPDCPGEWLRRGHGNQHYTEDISVYPDGRPYCTMSASDVVDDGTWVGPVDPGVITAWVECGMPPATTVRAALELINALSDLARGKPQSAPMPVPNESPVGSPPSGLPA